MYFILINNHYAVINAEIWIKTIAMFRENNNIIGYNNIVLACQ